MGACRELKPQLEVIPYQTTCWNNRLQEQGYTWCFIAMFCSLAPVPTKTNSVLCSQCVPYHIPLCSLTTPWSALSPACDDLVIYILIALCTLSFTIFVGKLWSLGTSIALHHLHHTLVSPSLLVLTTATTIDIFRTTFTGFKEQLDYSKKCMWKKMERTN
jgi:hypothetical protein